MKREFTVWLRKKMIKPVPFPEAYLPVEGNGFLGSDSSRHYEEIAKVLGYDPAQLVEIQLANFFLVQGIYLYDFDQVDCWLTTARKRAGIGEWWWSPLRDEDEMTNYSWRAEYMSCSHRRLKDGFYYHKFCKTYDKLISVRTMEISTKLKEEFGDRIKFFASDCDDPGIPSFVMVRAARPGGSFRQNHFIFGFSRSVSSIKKNDL